MAQHLTYHFTRWHSHAAQIIYYLSQHSIWPTSSVEALSDMLNTQQHRASLISSSCCIKQASFLLLYRRQHGMQGLSPSSGVTEGKPEPAPLLLARCPTLCSAMPLMFDTIIAKLFSECRRQQGMLKLSPSSGVTEGKAGPAPLLPAHCSTPCMPLSKTTLKCFAGDRRQQGMLGLPPPSGVMEGV